MINISLLVINMRTTLFLLMLVQIFGKFYYALGLYRELVEDFASAMLSVMVESHQYLWDVYHNN